MRPCYKKLEQEPLPPFYENLVFWAPLTEGDLTDHISGVEPIIDSRCEFYYDSLECMYILDTYKNLNKTNVYADALQWTGLNLGIFTGNSSINNTETTVCFLIKPIIQTTENRIFPSNSTSKPDGKYRRFGIFRYVLPINELHKIVLVHKHGMAAIYCDGIHINDSSYDMNGDLNIEILDTLFTIGNIYWGGNDQTFKAYYKNVMLYNRALTAEEVAQL